MIKFNLRLAMVLVPCLALFSACNSGNTDQQKSTAVLDTVSLSSKSFALAYQDGSKIVATSIDTMKQISFGGATDPAISPDGNKLAYTVSDSIGNRSIWVADMENKSQLQLQVNSKNYYHAAWSPSGKMIAFNLFSDKSIWKVAVIKADNTGLLVLDGKLTTSLFSPTWKSETEVIAHDLKSIYTFDTAGKLIDAKAIAELLGADYHISSHNSFFYTSDRNKLIFNAGFGPPVGELKNQADGVFVLDFNTKKVTRISPEGMDVPYVFLTADDRIFFSGAEKPFTQSKIYVSDLGGNIKTVVNKGTNPTGTLK
jgi:TolB protein